MHCSVQPLLLWPNQFWQDFSITGLYGENYKLIARKDQQTTLTLEYAAQLNYGDPSVFLDHTHNEVSGTENYFEVSPRLSLGKVSGQKLAISPVQDVLITSTWESGEHFDNYLYGILYGIAFDLALPYFQYASLNFYHAYNDLTQDDYQLTISYAIPFKVTTEEFLVDGSLDWFSAEQDHSSELNWTTQYKWNIGQHISPETKLYLGVKHSLWHNKYGIHHAKENYVSALVKYHF